MADEYVLKEDILKYLEKKSNISISTNTAIGKDISQAIDVLYCDIDNMVSADVQPVCHGRWEYIRNVRLSGTVKLCECNQCHNKIFGGLRYCGNCGARMEQED